MSDPATQADVRVRAAVPQEHAAVGELTAAVYRGDGFLAEDDPYLAHLRDAAGRATDAELWVAVGREPDGSVLGTVTYCPAGSPWREIARDGEGEFRMLAVDPAARGRGVGRLLVESCLDRARQDGCHAVALSSLDTMTAAHRLYERLGFVRTPALDWGVEGVRLITYRRPL